MVYDHEEFIQPRATTAYMVDNVETDALSVERKPDKVVTVLIDDVNAKCVCEGPH